MIHHFYRRRSEKNQARSSIATCNSNSHRNSNMPADSVWLSCSVSRLSGNAADDGVDQMRGRILGGEGMMRGEAINERKA